MKNKLTLLLILCCVVHLWLCSSCNWQDKGIREGGKFKNFMLLDTDGQRFYLNDQKGKIMVLVFWATWCNPCKKELMELESYRRETKNPKLFISGICFDPEDLDKVKKITKILDIHFPVLIDKDARVYKKLNTNIAPVTLLVRPDYTIDRIIYGFDLQVKRKLISRIELLTEE